MDLYYLVSRNKYQYMKRFVLIVSILCACVMAHAQSIEKAKASYQQFTLLRTSETSSDRLYSALHQCCKDYQAVLNNPSTSTYDQMEAKSTLKELYPHLQNAAAYYSNRRGGMSNAILFAQAFVDIPLLPAFRADTYMRDEQYANMVYFVAANTYNAHDYKRAVKYLRLYIDLGISSRQQDVYKSLSQAYLNLREYDLAMATMEEYLHIFPQDFTILSMIINLCIEQQDNTNLQKYVTQALAIQPNNKTLLNIQGKLYEDTFEFQKALGIYNQMLKENPNSLNINQHVALNCYNLGVMDYNRASMAEDEATAKRLDYQSKEYFAAAATTLRIIVENDPTDVKYVQALATAYSCLGNETQLNNMNMKLRQMGRNEVARDVMPTLISHSGKISSPSDMGRPTSGQNYGYSNGASNHTPAMQSGSVSDDLPLYSVFAKEYVETRLRKWQEKDPYETIDEYTTRVNESTRNIKVEELKKEAEAKYIADCTKKISFYDMKLKPYDAENSVFLVESPYGELVVPVPRERNEARIFEGSWNGMEFKNPEFYINNDKLMLASLTFVTPTGNSYRFDVDKGLNYTETVIDIAFDPLDKNMFDQNKAHGNNGPRVIKNTVKMGTSDVDVNIPETSTINPKTFAVIISNENYGMVAPVPMALNDGKTFSEYCKKTLGLPEKNVLLFPDASYGVMLRAVSRIKNIAEAYSGDINVIFYYAGHGIPNESTKDAFLLPIDADGKQTEACYSLNRLYSELGALNARSVVVFLDACFSGAGREGDMLASARGVALTPKKEAPKGNMVIFSAASNDETAFPYLEKGHGLFTYFLLKKLQETKGNVTLQALSEYIISNVKQRSVVENDKPQTPSVSSSGALLDGWQNLQLNGKQ